ncbi:MAG TPA: hypothetical protein VEH31_03190 [Streptosporangiaceae bacterium]|nr:hypothetical protein [Streptosporangiaceae bacterium]
MSLWDARTRPAVPPRTQPPDGSPTPTAAATPTRPVAAPPSQPPVAPRPDGRIREGSSRGRERDGAADDVNTVYSRQ